MYVFKEQIYLIIGNSGLEIDTTQLITLTYKVIKRLPTGEVIVDVFINQKKVYNTIDHNILLKKICEKLYYFGH